MDSANGTPFQRKKVKEAATALIAFHKTKEDANEVLFGDPPKVQLQISVWKIANTKSTTHRLKLPHRPHSGSLDVCLFAKDEANKDAEQCQFHYKEKLSSQGITCVNEVIPLKMLKTEYIPFEARRKLARSYQLFLADNRILRLLHSHLGKEFYKRNRYPVAVDLRKKDLKSELTAAIDATYFILTHRGSCSTVNVGHVGMSAEDIADNIMVAVEKVEKIVSGGWANVKSVFVRTEKSVSLPIFASLVHDDWETPQQEQKQGPGAKKQKGGDSENSVDNADVRKLRKQMRIEGAREESKETTRQKTKRKMAGGAAASLEKPTKKSKQQEAVGSRVKKPTPKIGGKKKK